MQTDFWHNASLADNLPLGKGVEASSSAARLCQDSPPRASAPPTSGRTSWLLFAAVALLLFSRLLKAVLLEGRSPTRWRDDCPYSAGPSPWARHWPVSSSAGHSPGSSGAWRPSWGPGRRSPGRWCSSSPVSPR
ncbi:hypothetical protein NKH77_50450 [Streptomyces sp. M19]